MVQERDKRTAGDLFLRSNAQVGGWIQEHSPSIAKRDEVEHTDIHADKLEDMVMEVYGKSFLTDYIYSEKQEPRPSPKYK